MSELLELFLLLRSTPHEYVVMRMITLLELTFVMLEHNLAITSMYFNLYVLLWCVLTRYIEGGTSAEGVPE